MRVAQILNEKYDPSKQYPDTEAGAIECFTDVSVYEPKDITKIYPDPYTKNVWAIHTNKKGYGPQKHVVWLEDHDFATDDRSGEEDFKVSESATAGATGAGAIASVSGVIGGGDILRRSIYGNTTKKKKKAPNS